MRLEIRVERGMRAEEQSRDRITMEVDGGKINGLEMYFLFLTFPFPCFSCTENESCDLFVRVRARI